MKVEFRDTNEQLVLPNSQMISKAYQSYSIEDARELSNLITYLKDQISSIKPEAEASRRAAQDYGYANNLQQQTDYLLSNIAGARLETK